MVFFLTPDFHFAHQNLTIIITIKLEIFSLQKAINNKRRSASRKNMAPKGFWQTIS